MDGDPRWRCQGGLRWNQFWRRTAPADGGKWGTRKDGCEYAYYAHIPVCISCMTFKLKLQLYVYYYYYIIYIYIYLYIHIYIYIYK